MKKKSPKQDKIFFREVILHSNTRSNKHKINFFEKNVVKIFHFESFFKQKDSNQKNTSKYYKYGKYNYLLPFSLSFFLCFFVCLSSCFQINQRYHQITQQVIQQNVLKYDIIKQKLVHLKQKLLLSKDFYSLFLSFSLFKSLNFRTFQEAVENFGNLPAVSFKSNFEV